MSSLALKMYVLPTKTQIKRFYNHCVLDLIVFELKWGNEAHDRFRGREGEINLVPTGVSLLHVDANFKGVARYQTSLTHFMHAHSKFQGKELFLKEVLIYFNVFKI